MFINLQIDRKLTSVVDLMLGDALNDRGDLLLHSERLDPKLEGVVGKGFHFLFRFFIENVET